MEYFFLQHVQEAPCMGTIHLGVVELKGDGQIISEPFLFVTPPDDERVIKNATVHSNSTVDFRINDSRRTYYHTVVRQVEILTCFCYLGRVFQILSVKLVKVFQIENIAGTDLSHFVPYYRVDSNQVVLHQLFTNG